MGTGYSSFYGGAPGVATAATPAVVTIDILKSRARYTFVALIILQLLMFSFMMAWYFLPSQWWWILAASLTELFSLLIVFAVWRWYLY